MRLSFSGAIVLATVAGCGSSTNDTADGGISGEDSGSDSPADSSVGDGIREAVEAYLTADDTTGEDALFARIDNEWKDVPFDVFESAVRERAPIELAAGNSEHDWVVQGRTSEHYFQYVPEALAGSRQAVPLVIYLHGAGGEAESFAEDASVHAVVDALGAVLVAPLCDPQCDWSATEDCARQVVTLVQHLERVLPVDADRVVLTGFSMGGRGSFSVGAAYPGAFAGVVPGAGSIGSIRNSTDPAAHKIDCLPHAENFISTRLWFWTGANDMPELLAQNEGCALVLTDEGATFTFEKIPGIGHTFRIEDWQPAMEWAFQAPRPRYPAHVIYHLAPQLSSVVAGGAWFQNDVRWTPYWAFFQDRKDATGEARIEGSRSAEEIAITTSNVARVAVYVPAEWAGSQSVRVRINGEVAFDGKITPDPRVLLREARARSDRSMTFAAKLELDVP